MSIPFYSGSGGVPAERPAGRSVDPSAARGGLWAAALLCIALVAASFGPGAARAQTGTQSGSALDEPVQDDAGNLPVSPDEPTFKLPYTPSLTTYGSPGLIDMPSAEMLPEGQYTTTLSYFGGQTRFTLTFQPTPWMSASFRYTGIDNWNLGGFSTYYDRGFDLRFRLKKETRLWPEITLGLQDFVGTGIYAAEYFVATKNFQLPPVGRNTLPGRLKATAGIGWGRLGSYNPLGTTGFRPPYNPNATGGEPAYDQWFRGDFALFGGLEYQPNDRLSLKLEYSSDDYVTETQTTSVFVKKSPFNFGVEYQWTPRTRIGAYYMYGSELGISAQIQLNPKYPTRPLTLAPAPQAVAARPSRNSNPAAWDESWAASRSRVLGLADRLAPILEEDGLILESLDVTANTAELRFRNLQYRSFANAVGRAARALAQVMPASGETFRLVPVEANMALSATIIRRSDLEALEFDGQSTQALLAVTGFADAGARSETAVVAPGLYPDFAWALTPYFDPAYFDPSQPIRMDVGVDLGATWRPAPGWVFAGKIRQRIAGNVKDGRSSNSVLPHVRTDQVKYAQYDTTLNNLFGAYYWKPREDLYARVTAGYLEAMYGGISTEVLWKPVGSPLALGLEANYVVQRDFDQRLGFQSYSVFTGHASAYYDFGAGFLARVDAGRYLAGDVGATFSLDRYFDNGWSVGGFFTLTNVSAADFGEGSFDKGIRFSMPLTWFLGQPSRKSTGTTIRPVQRDGGQMVHVPGRLYGQVREAHSKALSDQWARVWE